MPGTANTDSATSHGTHRLDLYPEPRAECGPVTLQVVPVRDMDALAELIAAGLGDPDTGEAPALGEWYDPDDPTASARRGVGYHLTSYATLDANHVSVPLGIYVNEQLVGVQSAHSDTAATHREWGTGSWIGASHRRHGYGTHARAAILAVIFDAFDADWATTSAVTGNDGSLTVTARNGYEPDGTDIITLRGRTVTSHRFRLSRQQWQQRRRPGVTVTGFDALTRAIGIQPRNHTDQDEPG